MRVAYPSSWLLLFAIPPRQRRGAAEMVDNPPTPPGQHKTGTKSHEADMNGDAMKQQVCRR
jgi:hypothetical protein